MTHYPLLFGCREFVEGNGFIAIVAVSGCALLSDEDGEVWVDGVNPGGFSAKGKSPSEAIAEFRSTVRMILLDIASDAGSFQDFCDEVLRFCDETNVPALRDWEEAVQQAI